MTKRLFITGNSSGLGRGLTETYLARGWEVYGISRRGCDGLSGALFDLRCDLADQEALPLALENLLGELSHLDLVILNAGVLGKIQDLRDTPMEEILSTMEINVWANKQILDWFARSSITVDQVVTVSSGAAVNGNRGWGAYALSKAALNMLTQLYAAEMPQSHFTALAPGLIDTAMQDYICDRVDDPKFKSLERLRSARGTEAMPHPGEAGEKIADAVPKLRDYPSGAFVDIRNL